jgi:DNA-directed RNA polymerase subunit RPC12/RpoP
MLIEMNRFLTKKEIVRLYWNDLWSGCDFCPDEQKGIACAYCDRRIGEYREEGSGSVDIYWIEKDNLRRLDIPTWQKDVLLVPKNTYLCGRCGKPLEMGATFFFGGSISWDVRLNWQRTALRLLAAKLLRVQKHTEYQRDTGFQAPGYVKDIQPPQPGSLALDAWCQVGEE